MKTYFISVYDIENLAKKRLIDELTLQAEDKSDAQDKAHCMSYEKFPNVKRMVSIREM